MRQYNFSINNNSYEVVIKQVTEEDITTLVNGAEYVVRIQDIKDLSKNSSVSPFKPTVPVAQTSRETAVSQPTPAAGKTGAQTPGGGEGICSPMPGQIIGVFVSKGEKVLAGQKVLILEAMKLENIITADKEGTVLNIFVKEGDIVNQNQPLLVIG
jgi:biotin carboxyl carrier protein